MVAVAAILLSTVFLTPFDTAFAQGRPGAGPGVRSVQNVERAWELQAKGVAAELALTPELTGKLVDAYKAARQNHAKALQAGLQESGAERRDIDTFRKVNDAEKVKFEAAVKEFLTPEQTAKAVTTLGSFNRRWDRLVAVLDTLKLDEASLSKAMTRVAAYAAESDQVMRAAMEKDDFESARGDMTKLREKLDTDLAGILTPEQLAVWKETTAMRGGRGMGRREGAPAPQPAQ
jgi:Spy/CpxP family protein refolding chaperone